MGTGVRFQNWPERLNDFLSEDHIFNWATCNCVLFSSDAVFSITGVDYAKKYRALKTKKGILSKFQKEFKGDITLAATLNLGEPISVRMATRGDVVSIKLEAGQALGICNGANSVFLSEHDGIIRLPTLDCDKAWKI